MFLPVENIRLDERLSEKMMRAFLIIYFIIKNKYQKNKICKVINIMLLTYIYIYITISIDIYRWKRGTWKLRHEYVIFYKSLLLLFPYRFCKAWQSSNKWRINMNVQQFHSGIFLIQNHFLLDLIYYINWEFLFLAI